MVRKAENVIFSYRRRALFTFGCFIESLDMKFRENSHASIPLKKEYYAFWACTSYIGYFNNSKTFQITRASDQQRDGITYRGDFRCFDIWWGDQ